MSFLFSSESVSEGHPDKVCDQVSDAVLDAALAQDPNSRVAVECFASTGLLIVGGEVTTHATLDVPEIARRTIEGIGYSKYELGFDSDSCSVLVCLQKQSPDIAQGVNKGEGLFKEMGAGDQGMMFGYACRQTPSLMPMPIDLAHKLVRRLSEVRKSNAIAYLRPDSKAQVTIEYEGRTPVRVHTVVISTQHDPDVDQEQIAKDVYAEVIRPVVPEHLLSDATRYLINPTGRFVIGGPKGDTGLTGRKIIVDTYGGWGRHGGGAFSGKDGTKVDRSGAYMARYVAKNLVSAGLADEVEIQLAYAIGVAHPVSVDVDAKGTSRLTENELEVLVRDTFDLTPEGIIKKLELQKPGFQKVAAYGHFGRDDLNLSWERLDSVALLKKKLPAAVTADR